MSLRSALLVFLLFPFIAYGLEFTFPKNAEGWEGDFTDYPADQESFYELSWGWENLPTPCEGHRGRLLEKGLFLSGNNHSDDLFMFVRRKIGGLKPDTSYALNFSVLIETNTPISSIGIGGSPGESVYFKAGATTEMPQKELIDGFYQLNADKGDQSQGGQSALVMGNLANPLVDSDAPQFLPKELSSDETLLVQSNSKGEFWIFLGSDSGFEGSTKFYIAQVEFQAEELSL